MMLLPRAQHTQSANFSNLMQDRQTMTTPFSLTVTTTVDQSLPRQCANGRHMYCRREGSDFNQTLVWSLEQIYVTSILSFLGHLLALQVKFVLHLHRCSSGTLLLELLRAANFWRQSTCCSQWERQHQGGGQVNPQQPRGVRPELLRQPLVLQKFVSDSSNVCLPLPL
jgi:hypothetical protein